MDFRNFEVACRLVAGTNRIATVMSRMALPCADYLPIRLLRPPFAIPKVTHCLQWHRYQDQDPVIRQNPGRIEIIDFLDPMPDTLPS
jgi:hypothetical protein